MTQLPGSVTGDNTIREAAPGVQAIDVEAVNAKEKRQLYAARVAIYPKLVRGKFRNIKWAVMILTLGIYYLLPWIRYERAPGLPNQGFLLDFAHQRLYFFGIELWAQELYFITGVLVVSALGLFMVTSLTGRVWCGYACPQTVWTDLMVAAERLWQGDRNSRIRLANSPWSFDKIWRKGATYLTWLLISLGTGGAVIFYFADAPSLAYQLVHLEAPKVAYFFIFLVTVCTYVLGGMAREQVCTYMCPWPRIQGAMFDKDSLLITYRGFRGEPRGPLKRGENWDARGDCIDCKACIAACPAGIDIRNGAQLECIQCALCIDACDEIMKKIGRPGKLIAYDSFRNLDAESHGSLEPFRFIRARTMLYAAALGVVCIAMGVAFSLKSNLELNVLPNRNPLFVRDSDGSVRNGYTVHILNKTYKTRTFVLKAEGLPNPKLTAVGFEGKQTLEVTVAPDDVREVKVYVAIPEDDLPQLKDISTTFTFTITDVAGEGGKERRTNFRRP